MRSIVTKALPVFVAFAAGAGCGLWWSESGAKAPSPASVAPSSRPACRSARSSEVRRPLPAYGGNGESESVQASASVELVSDGPPAAEPEVTAAHEMRRVRRQAAREATEMRRLDFLSSLNLDLLTDEQRKRHLLYLEARVACDAVRKEVADLRAAGREMPESLQTRLADAESVLRADHEGELRIVREAAVRAAGLDERAVRQLMEDIAAIDGAFGKDVRAPVR